MLRKSSPVTNFVISFLLEEKQHKKFDLINYFLFFEITLLDFLAMYLGILRNCYIYEGRFGNLKYFRIYVNNKEIFCE